ncbi:hypothetical protein RirG_038570 [Rhizophagus irregularis DAOM 197198w]|nr:hypothetical protein RirG_038570 [Rhizophagus irregularis DAOM 197198w]
MSETGFEKDDVKGINKLYNEKPGTVGGKHNDYTAGSNSAPINGQRDIFSASNIIKPERNSDTMHVWCNLGNCAESVPFEAMRGNPNPSENMSNLSSCTRIPSPYPGRRIS